ncbi:MAG TPA: LemA family protein [Verrucomicrobiae bacterium]
MSNPAVIAPVVGTILGVVFLGMALRAGRRRRLLDDTPTCKTTGVFIGMVELKGTAESEQPLRSYLAEQRCVHYQWSVDEHWSRTVTEHYTDSNGKSQTRTKHESGWKTVADGGTMIPFYVQDDCGVVQVNPQGAELETVTMFEEMCGRGDALYYAKGPAFAVSDSDHRRRFVEKGIPLHQPVYVMGQARERSDIVAAEIAQSDKASMFMISTRNEESISGGMATAFWLWGIGGLIAMAGGFGIGFSQNINGAGPLPLIAGGVLYIACWFLGWAWMVFNSVVGLRQRVKQAWSQVDVQLKRRQDLIPNLVSTVKGLKDYESKLQTEVATMRAQMTATPPGEAGADFSGIAPLLVAIEENYPELKAEESFLNLQKNLIDTEQRIALARGYYNEIASFYNTRLEVVPDRFLAALAGMKPEALLLAESFERQAVEVKFAE